MKKSLLILSLLFSMCSYAAGTKIETATAKLLFGDLAHWKSVAQDVTEEKYNDPQLLDVMAQILAEHYADGKDEQADTLAWLCKALLAADNNRYQSLLTTIKKSSAHAKVIRYAERSLVQIKKREKVTQFSPGEMNLEALKPQYLDFKPQLPKQARADLTYEQHRLFFIANADLKKIKELAMEMERTKVGDKVIADALAEFLLRRWNKGEEHETDTLAWICRGLGKAEDKRYYKIVKNLSTDKETPNKIKRHAKKAVKLLRNRKNAEYYQAGSVDLDKIRDDLSV